jgi:hypothetical protein
MTLEEAVQNPPRRKLSVRQKIFSGLFGLLAALLYLNLVCVISKFQVHHWRAFDLPTPKSDFWNVCMNVVLLPFGSIPFLDQFALLLDIIFWGVIGGVLYALFCPRKIAAQLTKAVGRLFLFHFDIATLFYRGKCFVFH